MGVAFAAIVGGFDGRCLDEHEQAVRVFQQLVLPAEEVDQERGGLIRHDPFALPRAEWAELVEQLRGLRRTADAPPVVAWMTQRLVITVAPRVENRLVFRMRGMFVMSRELNRLANQMRPAQRMPRDQAVVRRVIVRHADPRARFAEHRRRFRLRPRLAAPIPHVQRGGKDPRVARPRAHFPTGLIDVDDELQGDPFGDRVVLFVPVAGRLTHSS